MKTIDEIKVQGGVFHYRERVKEEAKEWIKEMEEKGGFHEQTFWWIKNFFNLEEE